MFTEVAALGRDSNPPVHWTCWRGCELSEPIQVRSFIHFLYLNVRSVKFSVCIDFYFSLPVFCVGSPPQWDTSSRALGSDCHSGRSIRAVMWDGMRQDCSALSPSIRIYFTKWIFFFSALPPSLLSLSTSLSLLFFLWGTSDNKCLSIKAIFHLTFAWHIFFFPL